MRRLVVAIALVATACGGSSADPLSGTGSLPEPPSASIDDLTPPTAPPVEETYAFQTTTTSTTTTTTTTITTTVPASTTTTTEVICNLIEVSSDVLFDSGESELLAGAEVTLAVELADLLDADDPGAIVVIGHTDSAGSNEDNQALSEARADAVADWLIDNGFPSDLIEREGRGETQLKVPDRDEDGAFLAGPAAENRRVEISGSLLGCSIGG